VAFAQKGVAQPEMRTLRPRLGQEDADAGHWAKNIASIH